MDNESVQLTPDVVHALNGELMYQNKMAGTARADTKDNGLPGQLLTMEHYLGITRAAWATNSGDSAALDILRRVVATGIRALVRFGCPTRQGYEHCSLPLQNVRHTFDIADGDVGVTIRKGDKWSKVPAGTDLNLWICDRPHSGTACDPAIGCQHAGEGVVLGSWFGPMRDVPENLMRMEHNIDARVPATLMRMMRQAYGNVTWDLPVTALIYQRTWGNG